MLRDIGGKIRTLRKQKGLKISELAEKLGVSRSYLSNLEIHKTDSIQISVLEKLQEELGLFPDKFVKCIKEVDEFDLKLKKVIYHQLKQLNQHDPKEVEFLLNMINKRYELFAPPHNTFGKS